MLLPSIPNPSHSLIILFNLNIRNTNALQIYCHYKVFNLSLNKIVGCVYVVMQGSISWNVPHNTFLKLISMLHQMIWSFYSIILSHINVSRSLGLLWGTQNRGRGLELRKVAIW